MRAAYGPNPSAASQARLRVTVIASRGAVALRRRCRSAATGAYAAVEGGPAVRRALTAQTFIECDFERPAGLARWNVGGLRGDDERPRSRRTAQRDLDGELGRRSAIGFDRCRERHRQAEVEPGRTLPLIRRLSAGSRSTRSCCWTAAAETLAR